MKDLLEYIIKNIVDHPDDVTIDEHESDYGFVRLTIEVNPEDMGKVIGKKGKIIGAIRKIIKVKAVIDGKRVQVEINDPSNEKPPHPAVEEE